MDRAVHQQEQQGIPTIAIFAAPPFVFLVLAAQYELKLPLAVVLIVPMCCWPRYRAKL